MLIIVPLPEVVKPHNSRKGADFSKHVDSKRATPRYRTYEGLWQRIINNLDILILALCGLVAIKAQVSPRESAQRGQGLTKASGLAQPATTHPNSEFLCVMVLIKSKIKDVSVI